MNRTLLGLLVLAAPLAAQERFVGDWSGYWIRAGDSLPVTMHVRRDPTTNVYSATFDSDRLRVMGIPFSAVDLQGCCAVTLRLQGDRTTSLFTGTLRGGRLSGDFREAESVGRFVYTRQRAPAAPLLEREVTFRNGDVTLAGSLILPSTPGRHPAVVFLHGSGGEGRWASRFLAMTFAKHGIAALIHDKRGVGKSSGNWRTATLDDLAGDAAAAITQLRHEPAIDTTRIGVHGHSQGGTLSPMIGVRARAAFVIASAATGVPTDSTEIYSILNSVYPEAATSADSADARAYVSELVAVAYKGEPRTRFDTLVSRFRDRPWFFAPPAAEASYWSFSKDFARYHPLEWWAQVRVPVLLIYGADDQRVPAAESAARIAGELLRRSPGADVTARLLPGADHTFRLAPGPSGWPSTAPGYVETLLDWLSSRRDLDR